jgi:hypothetical protein
MSRGRTSSTPQVARSANNPSNLGTFDQLSLRVIEGNLGPVYKPVGRSDTSLTSNGGIGGGTYNHWYSVELAVPAWIILTKGPNKPRDLNVSVYDTNKKERPGRIIFQKDTISQEVALANFRFDPGNITVSLPAGDRKLLTDWSQSLSGESFFYYPYFDHVAAAGSDLYNTYEAYRLDKGDEMFYPLPRGKYLICISMTRNEPRSYEVGMVIEPQDDEVFILCEDTLVVNLALEDTLGGASNFEIPSPVTSGVVIPSGSNAFSTVLCSVEAPGGSVTVTNPQSWLISLSPTPEVDAEGVFLGEAPPEFFNTFHDHSLTDWTAAWQRDNRPNDQLPALFIPLLNRR